MGFKDYNSTQGDKFFNLIEQMFSSQTAKRLRHYYAANYRNIELPGKSVVDIGGGNGIHAFYCTSLGASSAVVVEPELDGSTSGVIKQFESIHEALGRPDVTLRESVIQELDLNEQTFDLILLQDSINHFDESACTTFKTDSNSREKYREIASKVRDLAHADTVLHFADCSSRNFFPSVGLSNPFDPGIEWEKHQPPEIWIRLFEEVGFEFRHLSWSTPSILGRLGRWLGFSSLPAFFHTSHFVVTMKYKGVVL